MRMHTSFTVANRLIFELIRLILAHFVLRAQPFPAWSRAPASRRHC